MFGAGGGILLVFSLVHLVVYTVAFYLIAHWIGSLVGTGRVRAPVAAVVVGAVLVGLSLAPIYGGGENLAAGNKLKYNAYEMYREALLEMRGALP